MTFPYCSKCQKPIQMGTNYTKVDDTTFHCEGCAGNPPLVSRAENQQFDTEHQQYPVCPHCGYEYTTDYYEMTGIDGHKCRECGEKFSLEAKITYTTWKSLPCGHQRCLNCNGCHDFNCIDAHERVDGCLA